MDVTPQRAEAHRDRGVSPMAHRTCGVLPKGSPRLRGIAVYAEGGSPRARGIAAGQKVLPGKKFPRGCVLLFASPRLVGMRRMKAHAYRRICG